MSNGKDATLWRILKAARDGLRNDIVFERMGTDSTAPAIRDDAIDIRKYSPGRDYEKEFRQAEKPGILISPASRMPQDPFAGENTRDDIRYPVLFQIIDHDDGDRERNLRTYLKWQEQVWKYFASQQLIDESGECVAFIAYFEMLDAVDKKLWVQHELFVAGVRIDFFSQESRGIT
jgi:hypothetical protein